MAKEDYSATPGGSLKLKGVKDSKVHKKQKRKRPKNGESDEATAHEEAEEQSLENALASEEDKEIKDPLLKDGQPSKGSGKTEAEKRYEERRQKRVCYLAQRYTSSEIAQRTS
jgi:protein FAM32A